MDAGAFLKKYSVHEKKRADYDGKLKNLAEKGKARMGKHMNLHEAQESGKEKRNIDILSKNGIEKYLLPQSMKKIMPSLTVLSETESTNTLLKKMALEGATEGTIIIADRQTGGRGRMGRSFYSPEGTGIYMSILLRPEDMKPAEALKVTTMAAVAACDAVEEVCGKNAMIKWVNDIFIDGRKTMGILTEAAFGVHNKIEYAVLGIGINAYAPEDGFPEEIEKVAGAVFDDKKEDGRNMLAASFINHFFDYYEERDNSDYSKRYREKSLAIGREIRVLSSEGEKRAIAMDVDDECRLIVKYPDETIEKLSSGEISIRLS